MATNLRRLVAAALLVGGAALTGGAPPVSADYVPFTTVDPVKGPPGTVITAKGDTWCATTTQEPGENIQPGIPGSVVVEFGIVDWPPQLGAETELVEVLATTQATVGADGMWSASITVPEGTPPGENYGVMGHCTVEYEAEATTTTTTEAPSTSTTLTDLDPVAPAAAGDAAGGKALEVLTIDFFPAQFEVTPAVDTPTTTVPAAAPANAVAGQAGYTG